MSFAKDRMGVIALAVHAPGSVRPLVRSLQQPPDVGAGIPASSVEAILDFKQIHERGQLSLSVGSNYRGLEEIAAGGCVFIGLGMLACLGLRASVLLSTGGLYLEGL
jgi:hypothetical protein